MFATNGVRTSDGAGPGVRYLPPLEAAALIQAKHAVYGERPPEATPDP